MIDKIRKHLSELGAMQAETHSADRRIVDAARVRHDAVQEEISALRSKALTDPESGRRYQELVTERGRLDRILGAP